MKWNGIISLHCDEFQVVNENCAILTEAIKRYRKIIASTIHSPMHRSKSHLRRAPTVIERPKWSDNELCDGYLDEVIVNLTQPCEEKPTENMKEKCLFDFEMLSIRFTFIEYNNLVIISDELVVVNGTAALSSDTIWGILRALESFSQLLVATDSRQAVSDSNLLRLFIKRKMQTMFNFQLRINSTHIVDEPRFSHRGLLVDTARHFINVFTLQQILDGMAYNKFNVFHWHIVDDHSFPYESEVFPELSARGAFHPTMTYSQKQIKDVIDYARLRGIRTIAEFDTPGHTRSWGVSHPEILTACEGTYAGKLGPMDPTKNATYDIMQGLLTEVVRVFPDAYVHLGGDEVGFECWESNSDIKAYMTKHNFTKYEQLEEKYIQRIVDMTTELKHKSIVWHEVFVNGVRLVPGTIVHVWTGDTSTLLNDVTAAGLPALASTCWYLDHLKNGGDWRKYYVCDPHDFPGNATQKELVLGGEACMWSEVVDNSNILQRIFPRASAAAERLWSQENVKDVVEASRRLEEHTCRMKTRGLPAQPPNSAGFCL